MPKDPETRLCHHEGRRFPLEEFEASSEHGWVHNREPRHTIRGKVLDDPDGEVMPASDQLPPDPEE
jgi:hypothetical protein